MVSPTPSQAGEFAPLPTPSRAWPADHAERRPRLSLRPFPRNARTHSPDQIRQVVASIQQWGWTMPVLIDESGEIIAGHARVLAAEALELDEVPVLVARGWSEDQKRAYVIADNKLAQNAGWDDALLTLELRDLNAAGFDLGLTGFAPGELQSIFGEAATSITGNTDPDAVPPLPSDPVTRRNDVWLMGDHRLMCGDCRESADMAALMSGGAANLAFTSPPYAEQRDYDAESGFTKIAPDTYVDWFAKVAANVAAHLASDGSWFVNIKPAASGLDTLLYVHDLVAAHVRAWGWHFVTEFCWERPGVPKLVRWRFKNMFEPIYHFARGEFKLHAEGMRRPSDNVPRARGAGAGNTNWAKHQGAAITASKMQRSPGFEWFGDKVGPGLAFPGNRLPSFTGTHTATGHAAAFPVGLPEWFIHAYTDSGDVVLDPFMGSGSTLIAAHGTHRRARGMELSPGYCDVVVRRWQDFTGKRATREADGAPFPAEPTPTDADRRKPTRTDDEARTQGGADAAASAARQPAKGRDAGRRARGSR